MPSRLLDNATIVSFASLRDDWVKGADLVTRLILRSATQAMVLDGFPRQWIPLLIHFGAKWQSATEPKPLIPIASDLGQTQLVEICSRAHREGTLRTLVEAFASLDPLVADVLYRLDRRVEWRHGDSSQRLPLTGWQSYGRAEVLALNRLILSSAQSKADIVIALPCARKRPYGKSRTHRRIWRELSRRGISKAQVDQVTVSSIGVVPEALWDHPVVLAYDSGVPDIYRILRLMRLYFRKAHYGTVVDCLEFKPYSDCLAITAKEGLIDTIRPGPPRRIKSLPEP